MSRRTKAQHPMAFASAVTVAAMLAVPLAAAAQPGPVLSTDEFTVRIPRKAGPAVFQVNAVVFLDDDPAAATFEVLNALSTTGTAATNADGIAVNTTPAFGNGDAANVQPPDHGAHPAAGDPARFRYTVGMVPTSNINASCENIDQTGNEDWTVRIPSGGPEITGVCLTSFEKVGSCGAPSTAIASTAPAQVATVLVSGSPVGQACDQLRPPVDLVMVLDKSGSMNSSTLGSSPRPKMDALHDAVGDLVTEWQALSQPSDQVGVVFFDSSARELDTTVIADPTSPPDLLSSFDAVSGTLAADVAVVSGGGSTSLGDGLIAAANALFDHGHGANGHRKVILAMSNGYENTDARVKVDNPADPTEVQTYPSGDPTDTTPLPHQDDLEIYAVTVGTSTAVKAEIPEGIALATGGFYVNSEDNAELLRPFFVELIQQFLKFGSWDTLKIVDGTLSGGSASTTVAVSSTTGEVSFHLMWLGDTRMTLEVTPPGSTTLSDNSNSGSLVIHTTLPLDAPHDPTQEWQVEIRDAGQGTATPFHLVVLADDHAVHSNLTVVGADYEPGDDIRLEARLYEFGQPIQDLSTASARLLKPGIPIGDILVDGGDPPADPDLSPADALLQAKLDADPDSLVLDPDTVLLRDDGNGPDDVAGDGVYTGEYPAVEPGHYQFLFSLEGDTEHVGRISRQKIESVHVRAVPAAGNTDTSTTTTTSGTAQTLTVDFTPRTRFNHRLGPGWAGFFVLTAPGIAPVTPTDRLDGTYRGVLSFPGPVQGPVSLHWVRTSTNLDTGVPPEKVLELAEEEGSGSTELIDDVLPHGGWSLSLHAGWVDPSSSVLDSGPSYGLDLEYRFNSRFALELFAGREQLDGRFGLPDVDVTHLSLNGKVYWQPATFEVFLVGGAGNYDFSPGSSELGFNLGAGIARSLTPTLGVEGTVKWHTVDTSPSLELLSAQAGLRIRF